MGRHESCQVSQCKYLTLGEYLLEPLEIRKPRASAEARTPDLRVHRPFGLTTRLREPGEGELRTETPCYACTGTSLLERLGATGTWRLKSFAMSLTT